MTAIEAEVVGGLAFLVLRRDQANRGFVIFLGLARDVTDRLVHEDRHETIEAALGRRVEFDLRVGIDPGAELIDDLAIDFDPALRNQFIGFATRTKTAFGHDFRKTDFFLGHTAILNLPSAAGHGWNGQYMKKYLVSSLIVGLMFLSSFNADAELRLTAKIYDIDLGAKSPALFDFKNDFERTSDKQVSTSVFTRPDGSTAAIEVTTFDATGKLKHYSWEDKQEGYSGSIEISGGKARFSFTKNGKTKTAEEAAGEDFLVGSMIPEDFQANWEKISKGEKLKRRLAVVDRVETIGFEFSKESEAEIDGQKVFVIKMRPSNFLISALVKPLRFYVKADGTKLLELRGRTLVRRQVGSSFKDLDALTIYNQAAGGNSK